MYSRVGDPSCGGILCDGSAPLPPRLHVADHLGTTKRTLNVMLIKRCSSARTSSKDDYQVRRGTAAGRFALQKDFDSCSSSISIESLGRAGVENGIEIPHFSRFSQGDFSAWWSKSRLYADCFSRFCARSILTSAHVQNGLVLPGSPNFSDNGCTGEIRSVGAEKLAEMDFLAAVGSRFLQ